MDLSLNEHQRMLERSVRSFMERRAPRSKIVNLQRSELGYEPDAWKAIAELGYSWRPASEAVRDYIRWTRAGRPVR